jgi:hypothetical protein
MSPARGLLENWRYAILIFLASSFQSIASWLTIAKYHRFPHDSISIFGLACALFVAASIAYWSPFVGDKAVFGSAAAAFVLMAVRMAHLTRLAMLTVYIAESSMLTFAAATCLILLWPRPQHPSHSG